MVPSDGRQITTVGRRKHCGLGEARGKVSRAATLVSLFAAVLATEVLVGSG
jgi:hypothetical protein